MASPLQFLLTAAHKDMTNPGSDAFLPHIILNQKLDPYTLPPDAPPIITNDIAITGIVLTGVSNIYLEIPTVSGADSETVTATGQILGNNSHDGYSSLPQQLVINGNFEFQAPFADVLYNMPGTFTATIQDAIPLTGGAEVAISPDGTSVSVNVTQFGINFSTDQLTNALTLNIKIKDQFKDLIRDKANEKLNSNDTKTDTKNKIIEQLNSDQVRGMFSQRLTDAVNQALKNALGM
ncbi:MAG: hypothetical protein H6668_15455 [Ardenticatenaceae bacterium]|nr:hypothetical protein [Ardenticatenaceae bacterium]